MDLSKCVHNRSFIMIVMRVLYLAPLVRRIFTFANVAKERFIISDGILYSWPPRTFFFWSFSCKKKLESAGC